MNRRWHLAMFLALAACGDDVGDTDPGQQGVGDGGSDCSNAKTWYQDADGDGFGVESTGVQECDQPSGYVESRPKGFDCDDDNPDINPSVPEVCDEFDVDEDCDGYPDDQDANVDLTLGSIWYLDDDQDGYGGPDVSVTTCDDPSTTSKRYSTTGDDCDDYDRTVNPGAIEYCDDENIDEDCDGLSDDDDPDVDLDDGVTWYTDADHDGHGAEGSTGTVYCDAPGGALSDDDSDCDDTDETVYPGATEYCDGLDTDCDDDATDVGLVSMQTPSGWIDLVSDFTGTATRPATPEILFSGSVYLCEGTYYVNLSIDSASVVLSARDGVGTVTLSGGGKGSVIVASDASLTADSIAIQDGSASNGGGIDLQSTEFALTDITVSSCLASVAGAGIAIRDGSTGTLDAVTIEGSTADGYGGGIYVGGSSPSTVEISGSTMSSNTVVGAGAASLTGQGGGIAVDEGSVATLSDTEVSGNAATVAGGGIATAADSELSLTDVLIDSNELKGSSTTGGGLYVDSGAVALDTVVLSSNSAASGGGAYFGSLSATGTMVDTDFDANTASSDGGGLYVRLSDVEMTDGSFTDNAATRAGGGFFLSFVSSGSFTAESVDFDGNTPSSGTLLTKSYYYGTDESFTCDYGTTGSCD